MELLFGRELLVITRQIKDDFFVVVGLVLEKNITIKPSPVPHSVVENSSCYRFNEIYQHGCDSGDPASRVAPVPGVAASVTPTSGVSASGEAPAASGATAIGVAPAPDVAASVSGVAAPGVAITNHNTRL